MKFRFFNRPKQSSTPNNGRRDLGSFICFDECGAIDESKTEEVGDPPWDFSDEKSSQHTSHAQKGNGYKQTRNPLQPMTDNKSTESYVGRVLNSFRAISPRKFEEISSNALAAAIWSASLATTQREPRFESRNIDELCQEIDGILQGAMGRYREGIMIDPLTGRRSCAVNIPQPIANLFGGRDKLLGEDFKYQPVVARDGRLYGPLEFAGEQAVQEQESKSLLERMRMHRNNAFTSIVAATALVTTGLIVSLPVKHPSKADLRTVPDPTKLYSSEGLLGKRSDIYLKSSEANMITQPDQSSPSPSKEPHKTGYKMLGKIQISPDILNMSREELLSELEPIAKIRGLTGLVMHFAPGFTQAQLWNLGAMQEAAKWSGIKLFEEDTAAEKHIGERYRDNGINDIYDNGNLVKLVDYLLSNNSNEVLSRQRSDSAAMLRVPHLEELLDATSKENWHSQDSVARKQTVRSERPSYDEAASGGPVKRQWEQYLGMQHSQYVAARSAHIKDMIDVGLITSARNKNGKITLYYNQQMLSYLAQEWGVGRGTIRTVTRSYIV